MSDVKEMQMQMQMEPEGTENDYVEFSLGTFSMCAGIIGLIRLLEYAVKIEPAATIVKELEAQGKSLYKAKRQTLKVSRRFFLECDLAQLYIETCNDEFKAKSRFIELMEKSRGILDSKMAEPKTGDEEWEKAVNGVYSDFSAMLLKASFKSGFKILEQIPGQPYVPDELAAAFKKEKDYDRKFLLFNRIYEILENKKVQEILLFKEAMYSKINLFIDGVAFFNRANATKDMAESYHEVFIKPLIKELKSDKKGKKRCIECGSEVTETVPISFMKDMADDLNRKKSYYWNCNPDANLCPMCAFAYSLCPLGFAYLGNDAIFINNNSDIASIQSMMEAFNKSEEDENGKQSWFKLYNMFTEEKLAGLANRVNNIQVIVLEKDKHYRMDIIDKRVITIFNKCHAQFAYLKNRYIKDNGVFVDLYQETVLAVLQKRSLYALMARILKVAINDGGNSDIGDKILEIQVVGENIMNENMDYLKTIREAGQDTRAMLIEGLYDAEKKESKIRGYALKLLNAVATGDRERFYELILRMYSGGRNKAIPDVLFASMDKELFKTIGFAYLFGLKSNENDVPKEQAEKEEEKQ